jgi:hypothetical protein
LEDLPFLRPDRPALHCIALHCIARHGIEWHAKAKACHTEAEEARLARPSPRTHRTAPVVRRDKTPFHAAPVRWRYAMEKARARVRRTSAARASAGDATGTGGINGRAEAAAIKG